MKNRSRLLLVSLSFTLFAGCGSSPTRVEQSIDLPEEVVPQAIEDTHFESTIERGPDYIDALRAEPAPAHPQVVEGRNERGDQRELASKGFVRIGNGRYAFDDEQSVADAIELGRSIGSDQVMLYRNFRADDGPDSREQFLAVYYVRFKLLFGATFRNPSAQEHAALRFEGGVQIGSVIGGTPASQANLLSGDFVVELDGDAIADRKQFQELLGNKAGKSVTLKIIRNQERMDRVVRLGAMPPLIKDP
jgi:hypothetical protein